MDILEHFREAGLRLALGPGGTLLVGPREKVSSAVSDQIRAARDALVMQLQIESRLERCRKMLAEDAGLRIAVSADEIGNQIHVTTIRDGVWDNMVVPASGFCMQTYLDGLAAGMQ